jgi:hypothetical protein
VTVSPQAAERVQEIAEAHGFRAWVLGHCVPDAEKQVWLNPRGLVGRDGRFTAT